MTDSGSRTSHAVIDAHTTDPVDYPDVAFEVAGEEDDIEALESFRSMSARLTWNRGFDAVAMTVIR